MKEVEHILNNTYVEEKEEITSQAMEQGKIESNDYAKQSGREYKSNEKQNGVKYKTKDKEERSQDKGEIIK